jgi:hypothetical protein
MPAGSRWENSVASLACVAAIHAGVAIAGPSETRAQSAGASAPTREASERIVNLALSGGQLQRILIVRHRTLKLRL